MIDERDEDEEVLKKGITLKSASKNILVILFIMVGALFIYFGLGPDQLSSYFIGFFLICIGTTLMQIQKQPPEPLKQTLTILVCGLCGLTKVRNYERGDFVFQKKDNCDKCHESMLIKQIYSVKLKRPIESKKKKKDTNSKSEKKE